MNWVDAVIIAGGVIGGIIGFRQGAILSVFGFLGLIAGVAVAGAASGLLADRLSPDGAMWAYVLAFTIILVVVLVIFVTIGSIIKKFIKIIMLGCFDSAVGALLGLFVGGLATVAIFIAIAKWAVGEPGSTIMERAIADSTLARLLIDSFSLLLAVLPREFRAVRSLF